MENESTGKTPQNLQNIQAKINQQHIYNMKDKRQTECDGFYAKQTNMVPECIKRQRLEAIIRF